VAGLPAAAGVKQRRYGAFFFVYHNRAFGFVHCGANVAVARKQASVRLTAYAVAEFSPSDLQHGLTLPDLLPAFTTSFLRGKMGKAI
jgi:hypothetical protein